MQAALVIIAVYVLIAVCVISTTEHAVSKCIKLIKVSVVQKIIYYANYSSKTLFRNEDLN